MAGRKPREIQLIIAAFLLFVWIGWLATQAFTKGRFPVVSHAQYLSSTLDVVVDLQAADREDATKAVIREVLWPRGREELVGTSISVANLPESRLPGDVARAQPGQFLLLLEGEKPNYRIAKLPISPGFPATSNLVIYPDLPVVRKQYAQLSKP